MNRVILLFLSFSFLLSCSEDDVPLFVMQSETDFVIPAGLNVIETHFFVQRNVPTFFKSVSSVDSSQVSQVIARRGLLKPVFDIIDLDYINSVNVYLLNPDNPQERKEIFFMDFIQFGNKQEINLFNTILDVKEHLVNDLMNLEIAINFRQVPIRTIDFRLEMSFSAYGYE